jgi:Pentapeptide repeats (8 copies)
MSGPQRPTIEPDDSEPTPERQAELRAAYEANVAAGRAPYEGVRIRTRGELQWVMRQRDWSGERDAGDDEQPNLSGVDLREVNLSHVALRRANLSGAFLRGTNLSHASLRGANLSGAYLRRTTLSGTNLHYVRMDALTTVTEVVLDTTTRLGDVVWNSAPLTLVDWSQAPRLGDELAMGEAKTGQDRRSASRAAVRAYRQLATALRDQGLNEDADRYAYRAQVLQRRGRLYQGHVLRWLGSLLLDAIAGYGYRPGRSILAYLLLVSGFAAAYFALGTSAGHPLTWYEALVVSLTAFHGRGFFAQQYAPGDPQSIIAAVEAVVGLVIEISFIATFTQRYFGK